MSSKKKHKKFQDNKEISPKENELNKTQEISSSNLEQENVKDAEFEEKDKKVTEEVSTQKVVSEESGVSESKDTPANDSKEETVDPLDEDDAIAWRVIGGIFLIVIAFLIFNAVRKNRQDTEVKVQRLDVIEADHIKGNREDAKVTIIEYSDLQCPACYLYEGFMQDLLESRGEEIRLVYRHFPLESIHPNAKVAAIATESASQQGKFWAMKEILFDRQTEWSEQQDPKELFEKYAEEIGLNVEQFAKDMDKDVVIKKVEDDLASARDLQLDSTPTFFIDGEKIEENPTSLEDFEKLVDDKLKQ